MRYLQNLSEPNGIPNPEIPCLQPLGGSNVDSVFHHSMTDQMSTRRLRELSDNE